MTELEQSNPAPAGGRGLWVPAPTRRGLVRAGAWSAPALIVAAAAPPAAADSVPPTGSLLLGGSITSFETNVGSDYWWSFGSGGVTITNQGPEIPVGALTLTLSFRGNDVLIPPLRINQLQHPDSDGWGAFGLDTTGSGPHDELTYTNQFAIGQDAIIMMPAMPVFDTVVSTFPQLGTFTLTATSAGRTPATPLVLEVPSNRKVEFDPGASALTTITVGGLQHTAIDFSSASVTITGPNQTNTDFHYLLLSIRHTDDTPPVQLFRESNPSSAGWSVETASNPDPIPTWKLEVHRPGGTLALPVTIPLADRPWIRGFDPAPLPTGQIHLDVWLDGVFNYWRDRWVLRVP